MRGARLSELEALYGDRYASFLRVAIALTGDREAARDAVQNGFARAIRRRGSYRGDGPLHAWVLRAVVNEAHRARPRADVELAGSVPEAAANGSALEDSQLRALLAALPKRQRHAVFLRYYADLDYRTIGYVLGIETGTVSATLAAAHRSLRRALEEVRR
jgi:RNA polymerase sigma-70 factor (ECF subfamily)